MAKESSIIGVMLGRATEVTWSHFFPLPVESGAPNENIVQNYLNIALLNLF